ncbi:MAG: hypothetical protein ACE5Q3_15225, partial [Alphaproteobacteria bacterium]
MTVAFQPFRPRLPWIGGDLQTLRNHVLRERADLTPWPGHRVETALDGGAGDRLVARLHRPRGSHPGRPLAVLIHGLTGCEASIYVVRAARVLLRAGYPVLRLNLRGAGPSRHTSLGFYHAGLTADLRAFFIGLPGPLRENGVVALGYSLG